MVKFSEDITLQICERVAEGESIRAICKDRAMPAMSTVFKWLANDETFAEQYARAKEEQADRLFEQVLEIADGAKPDTVSVARLQIDARKWMAGKLRPKKYGDRLELAGDPDSPLVAMPALIALVPPDDDSAA